MSIQDPFFVVRDEVQQALMMARSLYLRWRDIEDKLSLVSPEEKEYTTNELRNSLRSIDWDLEDLEETVSIVEKNPKKFKIDERELNERRNFIERTRAAVQDLRRQMLGTGSNHVNGTQENSNAQGLVSSNGLGLAIRPNHFGQLDTSSESTMHQEYQEDSPQQQQALIEPEDSQLDRMGAGMSRNFGHQNNEMEDQSALLDELGQEVEQPETGLRRALKRVTSVLSLDRRQWCAISLLLVGILILLIVFFTL